MHLQEVDGEVWTGLIWLRIGTEAGACECRNEHAGFIKWRNFLTRQGPVNFSGRTLLHGVIYLFIYLFS